MTDVVVFLDFDGVINTVATYANADSFADTVEASAGLLERELVARVQRVCDATGAGVVVVSAWRASFTNADLRALLLGAGLMAPVLGSVAKPVPAGDRRGEALLAWLAERPHVTRWCVIDDDPSHYRYVAAAYERLVLVGDGINDADVERAVAFLRPRSETHAPTPRERAESSESAAPKTPDFGPVAPRNPA